MNLVETALPGVVILEPKVFGDPRGFFMESWNARTMAGLGLDIAFVQDNHSRSARGVLRGMHFQREQSQGKLVRVISGAVYDVAVDVRRSSPNFGKWVGVELSAQNHRMLWVPPGFAHGFLVLEDGTDLFYKVTEFYHPASDTAFAWNDPQIGISWPDLGPDPSSTPTLSARDAVAPLFANIEVMA